MQLLDAGRNCNTLMARNPLLDYPNCLVCAKLYNLNYIQLSVFWAVISKLQSLHQNILVIIHTNLQWHKVRLWSGDTHSKSSSRGLTCYDTLYTSLEIFKNVEEMEHIKSFEIVVLYCLIQRMVSKAVGKSHFRCEK